MEKENKVIVRFDSNHGNEGLDVSFDPGNETVWLTQLQIAQLFETSTDNISLHLMNIFEEGELVESSTTEDFSVVRNEGNRKVRRTIKHYNLDAILSIGYRVKSKKATKFRIWVNSILSEYLKKGYVLNQTKFRIPNFGEITRMLDTYRQLDGDLPLSGNDVLEFMIAYERGLRILDDYDHQTFKLPEGNRETYRIRYDECLDIIRRSRFTGKNDNSGKKGINPLIQVFPRFIRRLKERNCIRLSNQKPPTSCTSSLKTIVSSTETNVSPPPFFSIFWIGTMRCSRVEKSGSVMRL